MKTYTGTRSVHQRIITVNGEPLRAIYTQGDRRSVPFEWGNESAGAKHLAQAILRDSGADGSMHLHAHHFVIEILSKLPTPWMFTSVDIEKWRRLKNMVEPSLRRASSSLRRSEAAPRLALLRPSDFPNFPVDPSKRERCKRAS